MYRFGVTVASALLGLCSVQLSAQIDYTSFAGYSKPTGGGDDTAHATVVSSASGLTGAAASSGKKIIKIKGTIDHALIVCANDKTFLGVGTDAKLTRSSFLIKNASNIIIRNITMTLPYPDKVSGSDHDNDVIHIEGSGASNIWIDHCELYNAYDGVKKDDYDGILDVKKGSTKITLSWCYIHDAWKTSLIGFSDSDAKDWQLAFHHNLFNYVNSRLPSIRGGTAAIFNNYFLAIPGTAVNCRVGATVYCEKNYFDGVGSGSKDGHTNLSEGPIGAYYSDAVGYWNAVDNIYINCRGNQPTTSTTQYKPSFMNNLGILIPAADVPAAVKEYAGIIGKTKTLKYPAVAVEKHAIVAPAGMKIFQTATTAVYTIRGVKIGNAGIPGGMRANGVYILKESGTAAITVYAPR